MATALPFHRAVVRDPAFAPAPGKSPSRVHTRWIETEFDNTIPAYAGSTDGEVEAERARDRRRRGRRQAPRGHPARRARRWRAGRPRPAARRSARPARRPAPGATGDALAAPMQGTIVKVAVEEGQEVAEGDLVVVLEAMKMEQPLTAHKAGTIEKLTAEVGATVPTRHRPLRDQGLTAPLRPCASAPTGARRPNDVTWKHAAHRLRPDQPSLAVAALTLWGAPAALAAPDVSEAAAALRGGDPVYSAPDAENALSRRRGRRPVGPDPRQRRPAVHRRAARVGGRRRHGRRDVLVALQGRGGPGRRLRGHRRRPVPGRIDGPVRGRPRDGGLPHPARRGCRGRPLGVRRPHRRALQHAAAPRRTPPRAAADPAS